VLLMVLLATLSCGRPAPRHEAEPPPVPPSSLIGKWFVVTPGDVATLDEDRIGRVGFPGRPVLLRRREIEVPDDSEVARTGAVFVVEAIVGTSGNIVKACLRKGPEVPGLEEELVRCLRGWKFRPAFYKGEPWAVDWSLTLAVRPRKRPS